MLAMSWPPRLDISASNSSSLRRSISRDTAPWSPISSRRCRRNAAPPWKHSAAYSWFGQSSIQRRSASPPGSANAACISRPYFTITTSQPKLRNMDLEFLPQPFAHHGVEALAVVVDHPPGVAQAVLPALQQRLEDVALVHLGVADQRDHPPLGPVLHPAMRLDVVLHQRGEQRLRDAEPDRAGGEIDVVGVLGARGIGLRALEAAEILQLLAASGARTDTGWRGTPGSHAASPRPGPAAAAPRNTAPT